MLKNWINSFKQVKPSQADLPDLAKTEAVYKAVFRNFYETYASFNEERRVSLVAKVKALTEATHASFEAATIRNRLSFEVRQDITLAFGALVLAAIPEAEIDSVLLFADEDGGDYSNPIVCVRTVNTLRRIEDPATKSYVGWLDWVAGVTQTTLAQHRKPMDPALEARLDSLLKGFTEATGVPVEFASFRYAPEYIRKTT